MKLFLKYATDKVCVYRSVKVALIVGSVIGLINHYDALFYGTLTTRRIFQILLTFLVPYSVATYGSAMQARYIELQKLKKLNTLASFLL